VRKSLVEDLLHDLSSGFVVYGIDRDEVDFGVHE
jgi:hypothetical protein